MTATVSGSGAAARVAASVKRLSDQSLLLARSGLAVVLGVMFLAGTGVSAAAKPRTGLSESQSAGGSGKMVTPVGLPELGELTRKEGSRVTHIRHMMDPASAHAEPAVQLTIPTYDGSGVIVHPSVYFNADGWSGWRYWMAMTPYPNADANFENPSIVVSQDGDNWVVPDGLTNPVVPDPNPGDSGGAYNSDPCIVVDDAGVMHLFWRQTGTGRDIIYHRSSVDGVNWGPAQESHSDASATRRLVAPSLTRLPDGTWVMYAVDIVPSPRQVLRYVGSSPLGPWSAPERVVISGTSDVPWHLEVRYLGGEWQMLAQGGGSGGGDLWAAVSTDGINFRAGPPLIARDPSWAPSYYKSSFVPAIRNGLLGWDLFAASSQWSVGTRTIGRTFVTFGGVVDSSELDIRIAELRAELARDPLVEHLRDMAAAMLLIRPYLAADTFDRANATTLGSTPAGGQLWERPGPPVAAGLEVIDGQAGSSTTATINIVSVINTGFWDHEAAVVVAATGSESWIQVRHVDSNNFLRCGFLIDAIWIQQVTAGAVAAGQNLSGGLTQDSAPFLLAVRCVGDQITVLRDGKALRTLTFAQGVGTATRVGLQTNNGKTRFDNFYVKRAV